MTSIGPVATDRVLVVDDEASLRRAYVRVLGKVGFVTEECECANEAIERLHAGERYCVVVTDLTMVGMNGLELALWLQQHHPDLPVIVATGDLMPPSVPATGAVFRWLLKPVPQQVLQGAVIEAAAAYRASKADNCKIRT